MRQVSVKSHSKDTYRQEITADGHTIVSDMSLDEGVTKQGPDPHELLLGALGACTSMTLKIFAERRGWKLDDVDVCLKEERVDDPASGKKITRITRDIKVSGDLDQEKIDALTKAADKCLVHKLLVGPKEIVSSLSLTN